MKIKLFVFVILVSLLIVTPAMANGPPPPPSFDIGTDQCGAYTVGVSFSGGRNTWYKLYVVVYRSAGGYGNGKQAIQKGSVSVTLSAAVPPGEYQVTSYLYRWKKGSGWKWMPSGNVRRYFTVNACPILGCTDPKAQNYIEAAEIDDGSCTYPPPPKPVCPLQLLRNYNPPEGWLPFCMVMTEGGVAVHRQPAICGAGIVEWIADNQPCGGMVMDDGTEQGTWRCDRYGYERRPIIVLKCLWQRHLNGQRDPESFAKCQALAP